MQPLWKDVGQQAEDYGSPGVPSWSLSSLHSVGKHFSDILIGIISDFVICIFDPFKFDSANTFVLEGNYPYWKIDNLLVAQSTLC